MTSTTTDTRPRSAWASYGQWWMRTPGSALYLLTVFVLAIVSLTVLITLLSTGAGLIILVIGLPILALSLLVARGFGVADRWLLRLTGLPEIAEPDVEPGRARPERLLDDAHPAAAQRALLGVPRCTA